MLFLMCDYSIKFFNYFTMFIDEIYAEKRCNEYQIRFETRFPHAATPSKEQIPY